MLKFNKFTQMVFNKVFIIAIFMVVGMMAVNQYSLYRKLGFMKSVSDPSGSAMRISQLYNSNEDLQKQITEEQTKLDELKSASSNSKDLEKLLQDDKNKYSIISGKTSVAGQGVLVTINHDLVASQIVDFVNAIKNIGAEAISLNGVRLIAQIPIKQFEGQNPYTMMIVGNSDILYDSIIRPGGAFDLIVNGKAEKSNSLVLPAAK